MTHNKWREAREAWLENKIKQNIQYVNRDVEFAAHLYGAFPNYTYEIERVIFNEPATIVFWKDGTKTVVKCYEETFDPEKGIAMAFMKKVRGENRAYYREIKKWSDKYYEAKKQEAEEPIYPTITIPKLDVDFSKILKDLTEGAKKKRGLF